MATKHPTFLGGQERALQEDSNRPTTEPIGMLAPHLPHLPFPDDDENDEFTEAVLSSNSRSPAEQTSTVADVSAIHVFTETEDTIKKNKCTKTATNQVLTLRGRTFLNRLRVLSVSVLLILIAAELVPNGPQPFWSKVAEGEYRFLLFP